MNESQFQRLIEKFQDDLLAEDECRELLEWFDKDDSHVKAFADELRVGNTLAALHVMESGRIALAVKDSLQQGDLAIDISRDVRQRIEGRQVLPADVDESKLPLRKWAPWLVAVAALFAFCFFLLTRPENNHRDVVATVQNVRNVQAVSAGDKLRSEQVLELVEGRVKINFQSGAKLAIQAPAELKLLGPNSAQLSRGVATVRVPGAIKGFVLVTPHQRITDLGTSFGVDVDSTGDTAISVFEGEIELEDNRSLVSGQTVALNATNETAREIPFAIDQFLNTWRVSFGVEELVGDVRVATPNERQTPGQAQDSDSLLLFPERENVLLTNDYVVDATEPGTYHRPFRKSTVNLAKNVRVDSFLLQFNPVRDDQVPVDQTFQGELHFDRPVIALILQKDLLDATDAQLALPATDFANVFRRGVNVDDLVTLSPDRRVLRVNLNVGNGVDQIRVLLASDNNKQTDN